MYEAKPGFSQRSFYETCDPWIFEKLPGIKTQVLLLGWTTPTLASGGVRARESSKKCATRVRFFLRVSREPSNDESIVPLSSSRGALFATSESLRPAISARAVSRPRPRRGDRLFPGREARVERPSGPGGSGARDGRGRARVARPRPVRRLEGLGALGAQSAFRARVRGSPRAFRATAPTPPRARRPRRGLRRGVQGASPALSRPRRASERRAPRSPSLGVSVLIMLCCT